jgi:hypothetical protein
MFTNLLVSAGMLVLTSLVPPSVDKLDVIVTQAGMCPSGTVIEMTMFKLADDKEDTPVVLAWARGGVPIAALDLTTNQIYIYQDKKEYPLDEIRAKYPTPCDLPHQDL